MNIMAKDHERGSPDSTRIGPHEVDGKSDLELRDEMHTAFTNDPSLLGQSRR